MNEENLRTSEIEHLIRDIERRMPALRAHCRFWRQAKKVHPNPALREVELDTLRNLRMFARMLDARLAAAPAEARTSARTHNESNDPASQTKGGGFGQTSH